MLFFCYAYVNRREYNKLNHCNCVHCAGNLLGRPLLYANLSESKAIVATFHEILWTDLLRLKWINTSDIEEVLFIA